MTCSPISIWKSIFLSFFSIIAFNSNSQLVTQTFSFTGSAQSFTIPDNSCSPQMTLEVRGAKGASAATAGGNGGAVKAVFSCTPGVVLHIYVGGQGSVSAGGFNGGGNGGQGYTTNGGGGGGASDVRIGGTSLTDRVIVAGGGGGSASVFNTFLIGGHGGGGSVCAGPLLGVGGAPGSGCNEGGTGSCAGGSVTLYASGGNGGGLTSAGGLAGVGVGGYGQAGSLGQGGEGGGFSGTYGGGGGSLNGSGGGGGGYYGGSGAMSGSTSCCSGGGGGSSFANTNIFSNVSFSPGVQNSHGLVVLTYSMAGPAVQAFATPTAYCGANSSTLTASNVDTYTWSTSVQNPSTVVSPTTITTYTISGTNTLGCVSSTQVTVYASLGLPSLTITPSSNSICLGNTVALTAEGAITYTWSNTIVNGASFSPTTSSVYTVTATNQCGISSSTILVNVFPLPVGLSSYPTVLCYGKSATLQANSTATSYSWEPVTLTSTNNSIIVSPTTATIYTVSATDGTCVGQATLNLNIIPSPTLQTSFSTTMICEGETINLSVTGGLSYTWNHPSLTGSFVTISPLTSTLHFVTGNNSYGCTDIGYFGISVKPSPTISVNSTNTLVCSGGPSTLTANGASSYSWNQGATSESLIVTPSATSIYTVTGTHSNGCKRANTITVSVYIPTVAVSPADTAICDGASVNLKSSAAVTHSWNGEAGPPFINLSPTSNTTIVLSISSVSAGLTCSASAIATINVNENPTVSIVHTKTVLCINDSPAILTANGAQVYSWSSSQSPNTPSITASNIQTSTYTVVGTDLNNCSASATITVKVEECTALKNHKDLENNLNIFPNPASDNVTIQFSGEETNLKIELTDLTGKVLFTHQFQGVGTENTLLMQVPSEKGFYFLRVSSGIQTTVTKLLVK